MEKSVPVRVRPWAPIDNQQNGSRKRAVFVCAGIRADVSIPGTLSDRPLGIRGCGTESVVCVIQAGSLGSGLVGFGVTERSAWDRKGVGGSNPGAGMSNPRGCMTDRRAGVTKTCARVTNGCVCVTNRRSCMTNDGAGVTKSGDRVTWNRIGVTFYQVRMTLRHVDVTRQGLCALFCHVEASNRHASASISHMDALTVMTRQQAVKIVSSPVMSK